MSSRLRLPGSGTAKRSRSAALMRTFFDAEVRRAARSLARRSPKCLDVGKCPLHLWGCRRASRPLQASHVRHGVRWSTIFRCRAACRPASHVFLVTQAKKSSMWVGHFSGQPPPRRRMAHAGGERVEDHSGAPPCEPRGLRVQGGDGTLPASSKVNQDRPQAKAAEVGSMEAPRAQCLDYL